MGTPGFAGPHEVHDSSQHRYSVRRIEKSRRGEDFPHLFAALARLVGATGDITPVQMPPRQTLISGRYFQVRPATRPQDHLVQANVGSGVGDQCQIRSFARLA
jgi:hypothetical protein